MDLSERILKLKDGRWLSRFIKSGDRTYGILVDDYGHYSDKVDIINLVDKIDNLRDIKGYDAEYVAEISADGLKRL